MHRPGVTAVARNAAYLAASRWVAVIIRVIYLFVLARFLGPDLYGFFAYAQSWYLAFLPLTSFGMNALLPREIGMGGKSAKQLIDTSLLVRLISALIVVIAAIFIGATYEDSDALRMVLILVAASLPARALWYWCGTLLVAFERTHYDFWLSMCFRSLELVAGVLVLWGGGGLLGVGLTHLIVWSLNAGAGLWLIHRRVTPLTLGYHTAAMRLLFRQGIPMSGQGVFLELLTSGPIAVSRHFLESLSSLGQLALVLRVANIVSSGAAAAMSAAIPAMSRSFKDGGNADLVFVRTGTKLALVVGTLITLLALALGESAVTLLFGPEYRLAGILLGNLTLMLAPLLAAIVVSQSLLVRGYTDFLALAAGISAAALLALLVPSVKYWDLGGVVVAVIVARILHLLLLAVFADTKRILSFTDVFLRPMLALSALIVSYLIVSQVNPLAAILGALIATGYWFWSVLSSAASSKSWAS